MFSYIKAQPPFNTFTQSKQKTDTEWDRVTIEYSLTQTYSTLETLSHTLSILACDWLKVSIRADNSIH